MAYLRNYLKRFSKLSLGWKIYLSLTVILVPVLSLTLFIQTSLTRPLLEEEVRQIGTSVCKSIATEIGVYKLMQNAKQLESRLIETTWLQPSIVRLDVFIKDEDTGKLSLFANNITGDSLPNLEDLPLDENVHTLLRTEDERKHWQIIQPIKDKKKVIGYMYAEVSLQLVDQIVHTFSRIASMGVLLSLGLLVLILSYYLRKMIENERKLKIVEIQLDEAHSQLFLNEKLDIMGQLTASFAHEIGTPLNSVSGHLQLLKDESKDGTTQNRIEIISSQVQRIAGIVKDFLASTHNPPRQTQLVDVSAIIQRILKLVSPRIQKNKIILNLNIAQNLPSIRIVPEDLEQVLLNLINNSLDALEEQMAKSRENSENYLSINVVVATHNENRFINIEIKDNGLGITPDNLKKVMKPFFTTKAPGQGTGLGLNICQQIIKKYTGKLDIDSSLGKGTKVTVEMPVSRT